MSCCHILIGEPHEDMSTPCAYDRVNGVNCSQIPVKFQRIPIFPSATEPTHSPSARTCGKRTQRNNTMEQHDGTTGQEDAMDSRTRERRRERHGVRRQRTTVKQASGNFPRRSRTAHKHITDALLSSTRLSTLFQAFLDVPELFGGLTRW